MLAPVVAERPVDGVHEYVDPPVADKVADDPLQIATPAPALIVGSAFTVTVTVAVLEHPVAPVPFIEYVVVTEGLAVTVDPVVAERPPDGDHL